LGEEDWFYLHFLWFGRTRSFAYTYPWGFKTS